MNDPPHQAFIFDQLLRNSQQTPVCILNSILIQPCVINGTVIQLLPVQVVQPAIIIYSMNIGTSIPVYEHSLAMTNNQDSQLTQNMPDSISYSAETSQPTQLDDSAQSVQKAFKMLPNDDWQLQETQLCENTCNVLEFDESPMSQEEITMEKESLSSSPVHDSANTSADSISSLVKMSHIPHINSQIASNKLRKYKKIHRNYSEETMEQAVVTVGSGHLSVRAASIEYGVPYSSIYRRIRKFETENGPILKKYLQKKKHFQENMERALRAYSQGDLTLSQCSRFYKVSYDSLIKKARKTNLKKSRMRSYTDEDMHKALSAVRECRLNLAEAEMSFGVPAPTIQERLKNENIALASGKFYTEENMMKAIAEIRGCRLTLAEAGIAFGIPASNIHYRLKQYILGRECWKN